MEITLGRMIRESRMRRGWSQEELVKRSGLRFTKSYVYQIENDIEVPTVLVLDRLAKAFGSDVKMMIRMIVEAETVHFKEKLLAKYMARLEIVNRNRIEKETDKWKKK